MSPPTRRIAVDAKNVHPWSTEPWIMVSIIRSSRPAISVIHPCR